MNVRTVSSNCSLKTNLVYWQFSSLDALDKGPAGNVFPATLYGGATLDANGLNLDGATQHALANGTAAWNFGTGGITVYARVKSTKSGQAYALWKYGNTASNSMGILQTSANRMGGYMRDGSSQVLTYSMTSGATINDGAVHTLAFVRTGTTIKTYLDGAQSGTATNPLFGSINLSVNTYPIAIGALRDTGGGYSNRWLGSIKSMYVWSRSLGAGEIKHLHDQGM